ncbi:muscular LMNA-interacting protein isoform X4 [Nannospalax galili]|uniref:muscular LMNA-interacting protein isoform X4 n=1 Tax=Nannospalax galili TaxID=1026970 RepID=UPI0004ED1510|nr:muscular LMNA-interacting protein isoform X4 [Nannospalax galili]
MNQCLREQGLLSACRNNYFQMNSCILAGSIQTTPKVSPGDSEAKPLLFTFVPAVRRLPTHIQLADTSKFLVKIPEEPGDKSPEAVNRFDSSDHMTFSCGSQQERGQGTLAYPSELTGRNSQGKGFETQEPQGMQQSDLFKAEYVFIVDSEGEEEATDKKGEQSPPGGTGAIADRPKSLAISSSLTSDVVRPKVRGVVLKSSSYPEASHGMAPQQKRGQLTSPTTSEQLACKPPAFSFVSTTNQKLPPGPANFSRVSVLEEFCTGRLDVSGAVVEETAAYVHTAAHDCPPTWKGASTLPFSPSTQLPGPSSRGPKAADPSRGLASETGKTTATPHSLSHRESSRTSPSPAPAASVKSPPASYIPVRIVMHALSPSPQPLTSSLQGSLSALCGQTSSTGNLSRSGVKSPVPSRLSLLTAMLRSNPSHQRPLSPASCPTFTLNSLASSTLTLDQKAKQTPPTPKKSLSSCSLRFGSPEQEPQTSAGTQQSRCLPHFPGSTPLSQVHPLSPPAPALSSFASLNVQKTEPGTLKSPVTALLQGSALSSADAPPVTPSSSSLCSSKDRQDGALRGPEKPKDVSTHTSALAATALPPASPVSESTAVPSLEKRFHPSPALSSLMDRSNRACSQQHSGPGPSPSTVPSAVSNASSASFPSLGLSILPSDNVPTQARQPRPSALYPNSGSGTFPSRIGKSESSISNHSSPVSAPSFPVSLTRTKEPITPWALSMPTGPENKKPKPYKTKSSYKAFAAIPTNTLLLEQKALDEPAKTESISKACTIDPPVEHSSDSPLKSPQTLLGSETIKAPTILPRAAGRETKYANLSSSSSTVSESQLTKPGVIRPVPIKSKLLLTKEEDVYEPNPFSKYLEDDSSLFSEQDVAIPHKPVSLHPLYQTKLYPPAKSLLHPQTLSHSDCLTPGPFSHLSSFSLRDEQENSPTFLSQNTYTKLGHPMVAIPEHETLDSKE